MGPVGGGDQRGHVEVLADDRCQLEHLPVRRGEPVQPGLDGVSHRLRRREAGRAQDGRPPASDQVAPHLAEEERVAPGLVAQHGGQRSGPAGGDTTLPHQEVGDVLGVQAGEVESTDAVQPVERGDRMGERLRAVRLGRTVRGEHEDPGVRGLLHDVPEQLQCRAPGPVQVLEHQHDRPLGGGRPQGDHGRVVEPPAVLRGAAARALAGQRRQPVGQRGRVLAGGRPGQRQPAAAQVRDESVERLHERLVRRPELLDAASEEDRAAPLVQDRRDLGEQPGLAAAGVATDEDQLPGPGGGLVPDLLEHGKLAGAPDEDRVRGPRPAHRQGWTGPSGHRRTTLVRSTGPVDDQI